ncbi:MAG: ATP-dependent nuclease [Planctomycetota bacterium]
MELINFSVSNFRSITAAHRVSFRRTSILIGKNNEGKSNILKALDVAMTAIQRHAISDKALLSRYRARKLMRLDESKYFWERDFPITLRERTSGKQTIFRLEFTLEENEISDFREMVGSNINGKLSVEIKVGTDNTPKFRIVQKRGIGAKALNSKTNLIAGFIDENILFNYIPAVRTEQEAIDVVRRMLSVRMRQLERKPEYKKALEKIRQLQAPVLSELSEQIKEPLIEFLPGIRSVSVQLPDEVTRSLLRKDFEIIIDDGTPTSLLYKGDGIKSLAALGLLKHRRTSYGASIIAIEEPESHLHPAAIHQVNRVIQELGENSQVVLTTHNPCFVDRQDIKSNIIVDSGKATPAKSVEQIRDLLGIKASDNLINASFVLVVEGSTDATVFSALLPELSSILSKAINNNLLVVNEIGGAGKLSYQLTMLNNSLCLYHVFLDHDTAGKEAFRKAQHDSLLGVKNVTFSRCNGSSKSELEDCLDVSVYSDALLDEFGVHTDVPEFRGNGKWSDRMKRVFCAQGKPFEDHDESEVKRVVAEAVKAEPTRALSRHKCHSINALVASLETMIQGVI